jgi:hypothetical protein
MASWALAQEKARLEYLESKEQYQRQRSWRAFNRLMERLLQLHSTNAVITSLINEHLLEQMVAKEQTRAAGLTEASQGAARSCA